RAIRAISSSSLRGVHWHCRNGRAGSLAGRPCLPHSNGGIPNGGGGPCPHPIPWGPEYRLSAGRNAEVRHHPPVGSARAAVTVEQRPVVGGAPGGTGHFADAEIDCAIGQALPEVQLP